MKDNGKFWSGLNVQILGVALAALGMGVVVPFAAAEDAAPGARAVRLSYVEGQVEVSQGNAVLATQALANTPLFEGTQLNTGEDGRAEIQFEDGSVVRLSPNSALTLSVLRGSSANGEAEITLEGGLGYFELQNSAQSG